MLDANVLFPAFLRDVHLRLAASDLYLPHWSERIHDEWIRNLLEKRPDLSPARIARTRARMDEHFPDAVVAGYEHLDLHFGGVHPKDRHVAAVALRAGAQRIVTQDLGHFPAEALQPHGIVPMHPDDFICELIRTDPFTVRRVLEAHRIELQKPPFSTAEYIVAFDGSDLGRAAAMLWP